MYDASASFLLLLKYMQTFGKIKKSYNNVINQYKSVLCSLYISFDNDPTKPIIILKFTDLEIMTK